METNFDLAIHYISLTYFPMFPTFVGNKKLLSRYNTWRKLFTEYEARGAVMKESEIWEHNSRYSRARIFC